MGWLGGSRGCVGTAEGLRPPFHAARTVWVLGWTKPHPDRADALTPASPKWCCCPRALRRGLQAPQAWAGEGSQGPGCGCVFTMARRPPPSLALSELPFLGHRHQRARSAVLLPPRPVAAPRGPRREEAGEPRPKQRLAWGWAWGWGAIPSAGSLPSALGVAKRPCGCSSSRRRRMVMVGTRSKFQVPVSIPSTLHASFPPIGSVSHARRAPRTVPGTQ